MPLLPPPPPQDYSLKPSGSADAASYIADETAKIAYVDGLVRQSYNRCGAYFENAERGYNLYLGNHWTDIAPGEFAQVVFNRIKSIILAQAAVQNGQRPKITFLPRQSGERGLVYVDATVYAKVPRTPETQAILALIQPEHLGQGVDDNGHPMRPQPLPPEISEQIAQAIEIGQIQTENAQASRLPAPQVIPPELLCEVNDTTAAEALQLVFDAKWDESNADYYVVADSFTNGIIGWNNIFYRWDPESENHLMHLCEFRQVYMDPTRPDISIAPTAVFDFCLCEEQAIAEFPEFSQAIDEGFSVGTPIPAGGIFYPLAAVYRSQTFAQKMGVIRFAWIRNQPYPMDVETALERGLIVEGQAPEEGHADNRLTGGNPAAAGTLPRGVDSDDQGAGAGSAQSPADEGGRDDLGAQSSGGAPSSGSDQVTQEETDAGSTGEIPAAAGGAAVPDAGAGQQFRPAYLLVVDGKPAHEVTPADDDWPKRRGIRELVFIRQKLVADRECQEADIPLTHNVNFPRMHGPWGQGTPEDLEPLNMAINRMLTDLVHHVATGSFPTQVIPDSVQKLRPPMAREVYVKPGTALTVPEDLFLRLAAHNRDPIFNLVPPNISADLWRFLEKLLELIDKQGDMADALQGDAPSGRSGVLQSQLYTAAQGPILFRALRGEMRLRYLARLMVGGIMRMPAKSMAKKCRKYPEYVWDALHEWMHDKLAYDIGVETVAGGGSAKAQRAVNLVSARAQGVEISQQTIMKAMDADPDQESKNNQEWARTNGQQQQPQPPQGA